MSGSGADCSVAGLRPSTAECQARPTARRVAAEQQQGWRGGVSSVFCPPATSMSSAPGGALTMAGHRDSGRERGHEQPEEDRRVCGGAGVARGPKLGRTIW